MNRFQARIDAERTEQLTGSSSDTDKQRAAFAQIRELIRANHGYHGCTRKIAPNFEEEYQKFIAMLNKPKDEEQVVEEKVEIPAVETPVEPVIEEPTVKPRRKKVVEEATEPADPFAE